MSHLAFPVLYLNLGGEMLYIIDQRLNAQKVPPDRSNKVMLEIIDVMFKQQFIESIFQSKLMCSKLAMRGLFEKLAHSSIMKLNAASMNKLFDLMTMAVKYQVCLSRSGSELFLVTLNHLYSLHNYVKIDAVINKRMNDIITKFIQTYACVKANGWRKIRQNLLNYFQDQTIRVSIFMKEDIQKQNGKFKYNVGGVLEYGMEPPGSIKSYDSHGKLKRVNNFNLIQEERAYVVCMNKPQIKQNGNRQTTLGNNMYRSETKGIETQRVVKKSQGIDDKSDFDNYQSDPNTRYQLNLLSKLLVGSEGEQKSTGQSNFKLNLFKSDVEESSAEVNAPVVIVEEPESNVIMVDASKDRNNASYLELMKDLDVSGPSNPSSQDLDLLSLMDQS